MKTILERKCKVISIVLFIIMILLSIADHCTTLFGDNILLKTMSMYYIIPCFWGVLILVIIFFMPKVYPLAKMSERYKIYFDAMLAGIVLIACRYAAGLFIYNLGKSPYDLSPYGILTNLISNFLPLIARELVRSYLLNTYGRNKNVGFIIFVSIISVICNLNINSITTVTNLETATIFVSEHIGPAICQSIFLSYLSIYGGAASTIIFVGLNYVFHWIFPILPVLNWLAEGVIGMIVPLYTTPLLISRYKIKKDINYHNKDNTKDLISTGVTMGFAVLLIWFVVGVFPVFPSVIATGSMEPIIYPGDIILIDKIKSEDDIEALQVGNIIHFKRDNIYITHRIIKIITDENGNLSFYTKGDNNSVEDAQKVQAVDIKGTLIMTVPKLGYPTLWLKRNQTVNRNDVEF